MPLIFYASFELGAWKGLSYTAICFDIMKVSSTAYKVAFLRTAENARLNKTKETLKAQKTEIKAQLNNIFYIHPSGRAAFLFADLFGKREAPVLI